jgi:hypothetical protein
MITYHSDDDAQVGDIVEVEPKPDIQNQTILETEDVSHIQNQAIVGTEDVSQIQNQVIVGTGNVSQIQNGAKGYRLPSDRTLFLNCSTPNVACRTIKCTAGPFDSTFQSSAVITMTMILNISGLGMFV